MGFVGNLNFLGINPKSLTVIEVKQGSEIVAMFALGTI